MPMRAEQTQEGDPVSSVWPRRRSVSLRPLPALTPAWPPASALAPSPEPFFMSKPRALGARSVDVLISVFSLSQSEGKVKRPGTDGGMRVLEDRPAVPTRTPRSRLLSAGWCQQALKCVPAASLGSLTSCVG